MNFIDKIELNLTALYYELWPKLKAKLRLFYWTVKYRGKKNIPKEVVFRSLADSLAHMNDNLNKAFLVGRDDLNKKEYKKMVTLLNKAEQFEDNVKRTILKDDPLR
jgi:hypothetical protein